MAILQETAAKVTADETSSTSNKDMHLLKREN
jgi:hypothetical protein